MAPKESDIMEQVDLLGATRAALLSFNLVKGRRLLLACSGGLDSMTLLHILHRVVEPNDLHVLTVDHQLHPNSDKRCLFVMESCDALSISCATAQADLDKIYSGSGIEDGARGERYRLLSEQAKKIDADAVLTAHTADDQAETLVMRLATGSGLRGMKGIPKVRGVIVRPWLDVSRHQVKTWAQAHGVRWVEDPSNRSDAYLRNRVRQRLMGPAVEIWGHTWVMNAARTAEHLAQASDLLNEMLEPEIRRWLDTTKTGIWIRREGFARLSRNLRRHLVLKALETVGQSARWNRRTSDHLDLVEHAIRTRPQGWSADLGHTVRLIVERDRVWLGPERNVETPPEVFITGEGHFIWNGWSVDVSRTPHRNADGRSFRVPGHIGMPWSIRSVDSGERFRRLGAPGSKKLRRLWCDMGVPRAQRSSLPVLSAGGKAVWAYGLGLCASVQDGASEGVWHVLITEPPGGD